jgi:hypothetical protein
MYINETTEEFPLYEGDIRLLYPDMGETFELPEGFSEVLSSPVPELLEGEKAIQAKPIINSDGQYEQVFVIESLTEEELENKAKMRSIYEKI